MMDRIWDEILNRFGQEVILRGRGEDCTVQALVQPCLDRSGEQEVPGPLGRGRQDRFRYMGPAGHLLDLDTLVEWQGRAYRVQSAHLVGEGVCPYWWAMLCPREEAAV